MTEKLGEQVRGNELDEIRGDIRAIVSRLDQLIADRKIPEPETMKGD